MNDVVRNILTFFRRFADDNNLLDSSNNLKIIDYYLYKDLTELEKWSKKWLPKFNPTLTIDVYFNSKT